MAKTIDDLRAMVVDVVKVKQNTDPTKTQGVRLRGLLSDILDTVQNLVDELGSSVLSDMQAEEEQQNIRLNAIDTNVQQLLTLTSTYNQLAKISDLPVIDLSPYQLISSAFKGDYNALTNKPVIPTYDLSVYQKKTEAFSGSYNSLTDKPVLFNSSYTSLSNKPDLTIYALKTDIPANQDLSAYAKKTDIPVVPTYDFSIYQKKADVITYDLTPYLLKANAVTSYTQLTDKPVLFNGTYTALSGKPNLFSGSYLDLSNIPSTFIPSSHAHIIGDITGLQLSLDAKQNITDSIAYSRLTGTPTIPLNKRTYTTGSELTTQVIKEYATSVTATGSGQVVDISIAGFTTVLTAQLTVELNSTNPATIPIVSLKSVSTTQLVINFLASNSTTVSILGSVVSGLQLASAVASGTKVHILIKGY
jgi:hypothetical protein